MTTLKQLDNFTRAYIRAALWSSNDEATPQGGEPLDDNYSASDLAPEAIERIATDCARFQREQSSSLRFCDEFICQSPFYATVLIRAVGHNAQRLGATVIVAQTK